MRQNCLDNRLNICNDTVEEIASCADIQYIERTLLIECFQLNVNAFDQTPTLLIKLKHFCLNAFFDWTLSLIKRFLWSNAFLDRMPSSIEHFLLSNAFFDRTLSLIERFLQSNTYKGCLHNWQFLPLWICTYTINKLFYHHILLIKKQIFWLFFSMSRFGFEKFHLGSTFSNIRSILSIEQHSIM